MKKSLLLAASGVLVALILTTALLTREKGSPSTAAAVPDAEETDQPIRIAYGAEVDINDYLVDGKTVIFDFTSRFCPPCEAIAPYLHKLHANLDDLVVVEVDINRPGIRKIDWQSPVARQYGMRSIPHFKIYDASGQLTAEGEPAYKQIVALIEAHVADDEG